MMNVKFYSQLLEHSQVVNTSSFIIEEVIEGDEFAFDAYFDENGEAVILGIENGTYIGLNEMGTEIWSRLDKPVRVSGLIETLVNLYVIQGVKIAEIGNKTKARH